MKPKIKVCMFGTYDKNYTSNKLILQGLRENQIEILEINAHTAVTRLDKKQEMSWYQLLKRILVKYRILIEILKNWQKIRTVDVIYVGYPGHFDVLLAYPLAKLFSKKLVFNPLLIFYTGFSEEQGILKKKSLLAQIIKMGETLIYNLCDLVFADTPFQKEYLIRDFSVPEKKLRVLPIGADDRYYQYTPYTNLSKKINVVYYGLYSPIHGVEYIIAAADILKTDPDIKFTMVGNRGHTFDVNLAKANELRFTNAKFYYDLPLEKHPPLIQEADMFLGFLQKHPSVDRVIPNKIYQGLALGKVVLTADAPVVRSLFTHKKNMYFCIPGSTDALVKAILELKNNPKLRQEIAENGHSLYQEKYTPRAVGKQMMAYISEIL